MSVERLEIIKQHPYRDGESFGGVGPYERIDAVAHYAVDPTDPRNTGVVDVGNVERGDDGMVRFDGDITILRPVDADAGCRTAMVEVPNRGRRTAFGIYNRAPAVLEHTEEIDPGDGLLLREGWTAAWFGWQWDVPRSPARMGMTVPPVLDANGGLQPTEIQCRLQLHQRTEAVDLTDHHVGMLGGHQTLPTADLDDRSARLTRRANLWDPATEIPRDSWRFAKAGDDGMPVADADHVWLDDGFEPGVIYDLIYNTAPTRWAGAGLLATRDFGAFLRSDADDNPCAGQLDHSIVTGQSQCGRFLRNFLHLGLNRGADDAAVYDGVLSHIAGGRRGEFNHRGAQPSVQPTPTFGHRFPFADEPQVDPASGHTDGLLSRQREAGMPKIIYTNTSSEYWRGDASLAHTSAADGTDIEPPADTRHYLWSSTQHSAGTVPLVSESVFGTKPGNHFNIIDYRPLMRSALSNLRSWIVDGTEPPPNAVPRVDDGSAVSRKQVLDQLAGSVPIVSPTFDGLRTIRPIDLGPDDAKGIGRFPAEPTGDAYPCTVSAIDADGNEIAGVRMPDITVPLATHTGWNPRHESIGASEQILEYLGSTVPFGTERVGDGDTRPSIGKRYADRADYLAKIRVEAEALVASRRLLADDVDTCVDIAAERWDAIVS